VFSVLEKAQGSVHGYECCLSETVGKRAVLQDNSILYRLRYFRPGVLGSSIDLIYVRKLTPAVVLVQALSPGNIASYSASLTS